MTIAIQRKIGFNFKYSKEGQGSTASEQKEGFHGWKITERGHSCWLSGKESACQSRRQSFNPWVKKIPWSRKWQHTPVFSPGKSHGQRSLVGYRQWGSQELDMTKWLNNNSNNYLEETSRVGGFLPRVIRHQGWEDSEWTDWVEFLLQPGHADPARLSPRWRPRHQKDSAETGWGLVK